MYPYKDKVLRTIYCRTAAQSSGISAIPRISQRRTATVIGLGMCFSFCWLTGKVQALASSKTLSLLNALALFVWVPILSLLPWYHEFILGTLLLGMSVHYSLGYSAILVFMLSLEDKMHQGLLLGTAASLAAASATITAVAGGGLSKLGAIGLLGVSSVCFLGAYGLIAMTSTKSNSVP